MLATYISKSLGKCHVGNVVFENQLNWAKQNGLFFSDSLERKANESGLYGIYAVEDIPADTLLASFPLDKLPRPKNSKLKNKVEGIDLSLIHFIAKEMEKDQSDFSGVFAGFEKLADMKNYSFYFFNEEEMSIINSMSPVLARWIMDAKRKAEQCIDFITSQCKDVDRTRVTEVYLNYRSRSYHPYGIVPVLDQFNHSDIKGQEVKLVKDKMCIYSKTSVSAGEEVFISYGIKDLYTHAIHYNYFDPTGVHIIEFGKKNIQVVQNPDSAAVYRHIKSKFKISEFTNNGNQVYFVSDPNVLLVEDSPTQALIDFLKESCIARIGSNTDERVLMGHALQYFAFLIDGQLSSNNAHSIAPDRVPKKLQRFHQLLLKERQMLLANRKKITTA